MKHFCINSILRTENEGDKGDIFGQNLAKEIILTIHKQDIRSHLYFKNRLVVMFSNLWIADALSIDPFNSWNTQYSCPGRHFPFFFFFSYIQWHKATLIGWNSFFLITQLFRTLKTDQMKLSLQSFAKNNTILLDQ